MIQKRKAAPTAVQGDSPNKKAMRSMADLLLSGQVDGHKWRNVVADIAASGSDSMEVLTRRAGSTANIQRNVLRFFLKDRWK